MVLAIVPCNSARRDSTSFVVARYFLPQLVAVLSDFPKPFSQQVGLIRLQPITGHSVQGLGLRQTIADGRFGDDVPVYSVRLRCLRNLSSRMTV